MHPWRIPPGKTLCEPHGGYAAEWLYQSEPETMKRTLYRCFCWRFRNILTSSPPQKKKGSRPRYYWVAFLWIRILWEKKSKPSNPRSRMSFISLAILRLPPSLVFSVYSVFSAWQEISASTQKTYHDTNFVPAFPYYHGNPQPWVITHLSRDYVKPSFFRGPRVHTGYLEHMEEYPWTNCDLLF